MSDITSRFRLLATLEEVSTAIGDGESFPTVVKLAGFAKQGDLAKAGGITRQSLDKYRKEKQALYKSIILGATAVKGME